MKYSIVRRQAELGRRLKLVHMRFHHEFIPITSKMDQTDKYKISASRRLTLPKKIIPGTGDTQRLKYIKRRLEKPPGPSKLSDYH
jgi:hypothetical protein